MDHQQGREVFLFPTDNHQSWNSFLFWTIIASPSWMAPVSLPFSITMAMLPLPTPRANVRRVWRERLSLRSAGCLRFRIAFPGGVQSTQLVNLARSVQWVTLAARPEGNNLRVSLEGECQTDTDARGIQAALEVLRMFGRAGLENPKTRKSMDPVAYGVLETVLKNADVSASAEQVRDPDGIHSRYPETRRNAEDE